MNIEEYKIILAKNMSSSNYKKGKRCFNSRLVKSINVNEDKEFNALDIYGKVSSESSLSEYSTNISIDLNNNSLVYTSCDCMDFEKNSDLHSLYFCKHLAATGLAYLEKMNKKLNEEKFSIWKDKIYDANNYNNGLTKKVNIDDGEDFGERFLKDLKLKEDNKTILNIETYMTLSTDDIYDGIKFYEVGFRVGLDKLYVLKDIEAFINAMDKGLNLDYGKNFSFNGKIHHFSEKDERLINFIREQIDLDNMFSSSYRRYGSDLIKGKTLKLLPSSMRRFLKIISHRGININYDGEEKLYYIKEENIPLELEIVENENNIEIKNIMESTPKILDSYGEVYLYEGNIYLINREQKTVYGKLHKELLSKDSIAFKKEAIGDLFTYVVPKIEDGAKNIKIDSNITKNMVREDLKLEFYLDKSRSSIWLSMKVIYGDESFDYIKGYNKENLIIRDLLREEEGKELLEEYKFFIEGDKFVFKGSDEDLYYFLKDGIEELESLGEVYYSESFASQKLYKGSSIKAEIKESNLGYLEFNFNIGDMKDEEIKNILKALKVNKKFYKLKSGSFINLEDRIVTDFLNILDDLTIDNNSFKRNMKIHKNRVLYLNKELTDSSVIEGRKILGDLAKDIIENKEIDYSIPDLLNGTLRDYQREGFKWFKNLSTYSFGGILADEMGLGKTIQTIVFLLSEPNKKTIIVTPTSLIYNWKDEFEKFAPSMKVLLLHGNKSEREEGMKVFEDYDVILTTYGTLKNDFEFYKDKSFDFSIIDEGQNIKNYSSLSSEAVKAINAKVKFALTGTPIENNLMELWSIFDYVMPTYLYNKSKFQDKFMGKDGDINKLRAMIKPFILRRLKKDVMLELPEKVEKKFFIEMSEGQKKVYKAFAEDVKNKLSSGEEDNNKITILSYLTKLRQICLDPSLVMEDYDGENSKLDVAMEIILDRIENNKKILLFSQFTSVLDVIKRKLDEEEIGYYYLDGGTKASSRIEMVNKFNEDEEKNIFLISLKAGGTGLNLTGASTVVHFDPWWNPAIEDQATDRAHRMGQKNSVEVIKLIGKGTIEEKILKLQESKKEIIDNIMGSNYENGTLLSSLTEEEILELFN
ncbi:DEAD/DEAH box helicase [Clostridium massiliamazoniense]|uniref:DEAD/DEAH box helicase n=1 Tax=Clostridium massiliamazoniense TaxID=1347366 RepID=UPI0006D774D4|nr:SNF2 helicase associated domain-containing protein [Clostridium massiliamazoniense]